MNYVVVIQPKNGEGREYKVFGPYTKPMAENMARLMTELRFEGQVELLGEVGVCKLERV